MPRLRSRGGAWLAWSTAGLSLAFVCVALPLIYHNRDNNSMGLDVPYGAFWSHAALAVFSLSYPSLGAIIASRRPRSPIGWIFCVVGLLLRFGSFAGAYAEYALVKRSGSIRGGELMLTLGIERTLGMVAALLAFVFLLFPNGHLPSPRWWYVALLDGVALVLAGLTLFAPGPVQEWGYGDVDNPLGVDALPHFLAGDLASLLAFICLGISGISLAHRYRITTPDERQQIKWLGYVGALMVLDSVWVFGWLGLSSLRDIAWLDDLGFPVGLGLMMFVFLVGIPAAVTIAILRYRLYDIDLLIKRTLVYTLLTTALALGYVGGVALLRPLLDPLTSPLVGEESQMSVVGTTLALAVLARPLHDRIRRTIDRRFYRRRYDAARTAEAFAAKLCDEVDLETICADLLEAVHETMQPAHASLWLRPSDWR